LLPALIGGGKPALARALSAIEQAPESDETLALLDAVWAAPRAHVLGLTGPPGVGKSTLVSALVRAWRAAGRTVGIIAVDPSSRRSGGALLGDRTRIELNPEDEGVFVRSMAARDQLGGVAQLTAAAAHLMRAVYDVVLIETVGVGQSETDVADLVDTVMLGIQPASGDSLQFMKAGIAEIPDIALITKADLGEVASRARRDLEAALAVAGASRDGWRTPVVELSAAEGRGLDGLLAALQAHHHHLDAEDRLSRRRASQEQRWLENALRLDYGRRGLVRARSSWPQLLADAALSPHRRLADLGRALAGDAGGARNLRNSAFAHRKDCA
jgi:LAO/AO transport system kinase